MPYTATAAKGSINIMLEGNAGEQVLLAPTAISATVTGISAPSGSTGMRLHIRVTNWIASGTLTVNGTGTPSSTEVITVPAPTLQQVQSAQMPAFDYVTNNAFTAITNITTTGVTNGIISVGGIQAGKFQVPATMKSQSKPKVYSPNEHNALIERDKKILQTVNETTIDEIKQDIYADLSLWWAYMMLGSPTIATIPAVPTSLKTTTAVSGTPLSLTSQPTAPGMILILTITSASGAGTVGIAGTNQYGQSVSETVTCSGNGTFYSSNVYSAVNASGVTITGLTGGSIAITGVYGWSLTFLSSGNKYTAAIEWYDGAGSWTHPFSFITDGDFDVKVDGEASITAKGMAQDKLQIGDRTTTPLSGISRINAIGTNLSDMPMVGWQTKVYMDAITGTPLTTAYADMQELKVSFKTPDEQHYTFVNSQNFNRVFAAKRECTVESTLNFVDVLQYQQFRQNLKQYLAFQFLGQYIGTDSGTAYYKSWTWTLPMRSDGTFEVTSDPSKAIVTAKANWRAEYDSGIGGSYKLVVVTQLPPTYPN